MEKGHSVLIRKEDTEEALQIMAEVPTKGYITEVGFDFDLKSTGKADRIKVVCSSEWECVLCQKACGLSLRKFKARSSSPGSSSFPTSPIKLGQGARSLSSSSNGERDLEATSLICPKSQATDATAAKSADGVQRYRVILSVLRAFGNRQRKTVLSSSNAHSKQERWGKGAKRRERKVQFIESES
ncbi:hypothetical protein E3N88_46092 [Mikania micrantha]|uniref:Uncharacterized protein n=1 Tax=Mikania micrantha TaxID=192012 RepID=A0A5N6L797_9ASTR|nr:hypothetical protein E3N88_46092 [Mikania micrantha]